VTRKIASIQERRGAIFVSAEHQTQAGFWIGDDQIAILSNPAPQELASAIKHALERSQSGVPTPPPNVRLDGPLLKAAKVSSWKTFVQSAKHVEVCQSADGFKVTPYRNLGAKEGFEPRTTDAIQLPLDSDQLGAAVLQALEAA
jgi:hypothetical protein